LVENEPPIRVAIASTTSFIASQRARNGDLSAEVGCDTLKPKPAVEAQNESASILRYQLG